MRRLPLDSSAQERDLLARIVSTPADELRGVLKALNDDQLYVAQTVVNDAADRKVERDVQVQREVASVVRWRFPRGWPSPASSRPVDSLPDA